MKRMITAVLAVSVVLVSVGAQADVTPQRVAKIAKKVFDREMRARALVPADGPTTVDHATTADHSITADHAITAGQATTAAHATTAEVAESCITERANPMAYAHVHRNGTIYASQAFGISQEHLFVEPESGDYCFSWLRPKGIQVTLELDETMRPRQDGETFPTPPPGSWDSVGYQPMPPAGPGELANPSVLVALGRGLNCPAGTEFYVMGIDPTTKNRMRGWVSFYLSLVL